MSKKAISRPKNNNKPLELVSKNLRIDQLIEKSKYIPENNKSSGSNIDNTNIDLQDINTRNIAQGLVKAINSLPEDIRSEVYDRIKKYMEKINHLKSTSEESLEEYDMQFFIQDLIEFITEKYKDIGTIH